MKHIPRLYIPKILFNENVSVEISFAQRNHIFNVLKFKEGDILKVFNESSGEWKAKLINKNTIIIMNQLRAMNNREIYPILACSLIHPNRMSMILEKSTELGVAKIIPIISNYTQYRKFNFDKAHQIIVGASEQCNRLSVPCLSKPIDLKSFLKNYNFDSKLFIADEKMSESAICYNEFSKSYEKLCCLVGPEGGFSDEERDLFSQYSFVKSISLGKNILRSETAVFALLSNRIFNIKQ